MPSIRLLFYINFMLKVQATDQVSRRFSVTNVVISVVQTKNAKIICDSEVLIIKINPDSKLLS